MRKGQKKCKHIYEGIYGLYVPRLVRRIIQGRLYLCTDYQCQIKGCKHWSKNHFINVMKDKRYKKP